MKQPITFKADQAFFESLDRARTATPVHQTRSEFIRNAMTSYLYFFETEMMPTLKKQKYEFQSLDHPVDFFSATGPQDYERHF